MKKWLSVLVSVMMLVSFVGCQKKETAAEIMQKVQDNQLSASGIGMEMNMDMSVSVAEVVMEMPMKMTVLADYPNDFENMKLIMNTSVEVMGTSVEMSAYFTEGYMYTDTNGIKTKEELSTVEAESFIEQANGSSMINIELLDEFTVEQTDDGYVLSGSFSQEDMMSAVEMVLGNSAMNDDLLKGLDIETMMENITVEQFDVSYGISTDYLLKSGTGSLKMTMNIEGEETVVDTKYTVFYEIYDEPQVELPDLSSWDQHRIACAVPSESGDMIFAIEAEGETVHLIKVTMTLYYEEYEMTTDEHKAMFKTYFEEYYHEYAQQGLNAVVEAGEDGLVVTLNLDYQNSSDEALAQIGFERGLTYSDLVIALAGAECTDY